MLKYISWDIWHMFTYVENRHYVIITFNCLSAGQAHALSWWHECTTHDTLKPIKTISNYTIMWKHTQIFHILCNNLVNKVQKLSLNSIFMKLNLPVFPYQTSKHMFRQSRAKTCNGLFHSEACNRNPWRIPIITETVWTGTTVTKCFGSHNLIFVPIPFVLMILIAKLNVP